jgi:hypothetical protein
LTGTTPNCSAASGGIARRSALAETKGTFAASSARGTVPSTQNPPTTTSAFASISSCAAAAALRGSQALSLTVSAGAGWPGQVFSASSMPSRMSWPCARSGHDSGITAPICIASAGAGAGCRGGAAKVSEAALAASRAISPEILLLDMLSPSRASNIV